MRSIERILEPSASAPITAICLSVLSTFAMSITVLQQLKFCQVFSCYNKAIPWQNPKNPTKASRKLRHPLPVSLSQLHPLLSSLQLYQTLDALAAIQIHPSQYLCDWSVG